MTKRQYLKLVRIQNELGDLQNKVECGNHDKLLLYNNGYESEQISCAIAAIECILQEVVI